MAKLYVGNLSFDTTDDTLRDLFTGNGIQVESARVIRDQYSNQSRGFGFVELAGGEDTARAISTLDGASLDGRTIKVNEARPQGARSAGGGGGRGGPGGGHGGRGGGGGGRGRGRF